MEYFLQNGVPNSAQIDKAEGRKTTLPDRRDFIDAYMHAGCTCIATLDAASWIDAREQVFA